MISDILDYIGTYADVRALLSLNNQELPDADLALDLYRIRLNMKLTAISGVYPADYAEGARNLVELHDALDDEDSMKNYIRLYAVYSVASQVLQSVGLRAYKTLSDGKATMTRFSPESVYKDTVTSVNSGLDELAQVIGTLFGETATDLELLRVVVPAIDLVEGA